MTAARLSRSEALLAAVLVVSSCTTPPISEAAMSVDEVVQFFQSQDKWVLTFVGYSGSGYEDEERMLTEARAFLADRDPLTTIVNIGATPEGIGAVYGIAKAMGFTTTGVVSTQAKVYGADVSPDVDHVCFVEDTTWGGLIEGTDRLSPTSQAMVDVTDEMIGIGGGAVGRDEMLAARQLGKPVRFVAADMNHARATEKAEKQGRTAPTDFRGDAHEALSEPSGS